MTLGGGTNLAESAGVGEPVFVVTATDDNEPAPTFNFEVAGGNEDASFALGMESGEIVYHGPVTDVANVFECPNFNNPADHVMHLLQTNVPRMKEMRDQHARGGLAGPYADYDYTQYAGP